MPDAFAVAEYFYSLAYSDRCFKSVWDHFRLTPHDAREARQLEDRLAKMVRDLDKANLVQHVVIRDSTDPLPRAPRLENELRRVYGLRQAVVVDIRSLVGEGEHTRAAAAANRLDDQIHERLGAWGARVLASCLRPPDHVATGGGRGPYFTVQKLNVVRSARYSGKIQSLTGHISTHVWDPDSRPDAPPYLDADNIAAILHGKLGTRGDLMQTRSPITARAAAPNVDQVSVALTGIGALGGGHRLKRYDGLDDVSAIQDLLKRINMLSETIERAADLPSSSLFHPVGDVCNWYFVVGEPASRIARREWAQLQRLISELNRKLVNTAPDAFSKITRRGMVLAVAGGPHKAHAIRHVLLTGKTEPWITHLVTDHVTARAILDESLGPARTGGPTSPAASRRC